MVGAHQLAQEDPPPSPPLVFVPPDLPPVWLPPLPPLPPLPLPPPPSSPEGEIVLVLFVGFVAFVLVLACAGHRNRRDRAAAAAAAAGSPAQRPPLPPRLPGPRVVREDGGRELRRACTGAANPPPPTARLPAFTYSHRSARRGGEEASTCSVCLAAFRLGETVRLLPACLHLYHAECIDPWLDAHSTCPICRSDADPSTDVAARRLPPV